MKRYYVIDVYEDIEVIGTTDNLDTALDMVSQREMILTMSVLHGFMIQHLKRI